MKKNLYDIHDGFSDQDLFLTFSGPMSQKLTVEMGEILKTKMSQKGASLSTAQKVFSILVELIQNIIHYSAEKNTTQRDMLEIAVTDNGIGISERNIAKLFRIDVIYTNLGTEKEKGTGLGLILCKKMVEKHGGRIRVESEEKKGTTFSLRCPVSEQIFIKASGQKPSATE